MHFSRNGQRQYCCWPVFPEEQAMSTGLGGASPRVCKVANRTSILSHARLTPPPTHRTLQRLCTAVERAMRNIMYDVRIGIRRRGMRAAQDTPLSTVPLVKRPADGAGGQ